MKKAVSVFSIAVLVLAMFSGCSRIKTPQMVNEIHFSLESINNLTISYDDEDIVFYSNGGYELIVKEYITENKSDYYAKVVEEEGSIHISEGNKPFSKKGFSRRVEVYLPQNYNKNLTVTSTSGGLDFSKTDINVLSLRIDNTSGVTGLSNVLADDIYISSTSGVIEASNMQANNIKLNTTSGSIICGSLNGNIAYTTTSGDIDVKSAIGMGTYKANNSGNISITYSEVRGDLHLYNKNGNINLLLPGDLEFEFEAVTKNGTVNTNFKQNIFTDKQTTKGTIGNKPEFDIKVETNNGDIEVKK